jgi:hypothetical protein
VAVRAWARCGVQPRRDDRTQALSPRGSSTAAVARPRSEPWIRLLPASSRCRSHCTPPPSKDIGAPAAPSTCGSTLRSPIRHSNAGVFPLAVVIAARHDPTRRLVLPGDHGRKWTNAHCELIHSVFRTKLLRPRSLVRDDAFQRPEQHFPCRVVTQTETYVGQASRRLHRGRSRLGRLRDRTPPDQGGPLGTAARGGSNRRRQVRQDAGDLRARDRHGALVALRDHPAAACEWPQDVRAAGPHERRGQFTERDDLHPRHGGRLRRMGRSGLRGLVLAGRVADVQARREQHAPLRRDARHGRAAARQ